MRKIIHVLTITCGIMAFASEGVVAQTSGEDLLRSSLPDRWMYATEMVQTLPSDDEWWKKFNDPLLDSLINVGIENNFNVLTAIHRMDMAKAQVKSAQSGYYPSIDLSAGYTKSRSAGAIAGSNVPSTNSSYFNLGASMSWQIDVFGKISASVKNKKALYNASRTEYLATMVSLTADIATYYFNLRIFQRQLMVTREHLASQKRVVDIVKARFDAGLVSKLDVAQSLTVYYSTEASVPQLETSVRQAENALAILLGVYPDVLHAQLNAEWTRPEIRHLVPAGIPADLLRRRPDIVAAEYEVSAYASALGVAKKDFLPTLTLNGTIGVSAHDAGDLFKDNSLQYSIAPTLSWTLFDGFGRKYAVAEAREQMKIGIENYNQTVLTAVQEVDNAMVAYTSSLKIIDSYTKVLEQSEEAFKLSVDLYKEGLTAFTNVVDAQINSLTYANTLISERGNAFISLIDLYKALGGSPVQ
ncbi:MAG: efflux transporter outer membrane subunit [Bacteroides sp.]|nr:efflux transporter outer membrane subunit [Bacteroides sp.]